MSEKDNQATGRELADAMAALVEGARKTADDIAYYSGGSTRNPSKERLADWAMENAPAILAALRTTSPGQREVGEVSELVERRLVPLAFIRAILHGDDEHRLWLLEAAAHWNSGQPVPEPKGFGRKDAELASLKGRLAEAVEALRPFSDKAIHRDARERPDDQGERFHFRYGDLRRARAFITQERAILTNDGGRDDG
jgi:hypothetical protein